MGCCSAWAPRSIRSPPFSAPSARGRATSSTTSSPRAPPATPEAAAAAAAAGHAATAGVVSIRARWRAVIEGLESIWPATHASARRGDVWAFTPIKVIGAALSDMVPLHKLSQWLTYSLLEPMEALGVTFSDMHLLTGVRASARESARAGLSSAPAPPPPHPRVSHPFALPRPPRLAPRRALQLAEYRNGGLFVDAGVLTPKPRDAELIAVGAPYDVGTELVVEWRALTVVLLDMTADALRAKLGVTAAQLPLAKVLQGGTWAAGRQIAREKRADGSAPIPLRTDGTVF